MQRNYINNIIRSVCDCVDYWTLLRTQSDLIYTTVENLEAIEGRTVQVWDY